MLNHKKFAVMILFFDCDQFILRTIDNCAKYVDKIYVLYSELPYSKYNLNSRRDFKNRSDKNILKKSNHYSKIELIEGVWETEEEQRNECLDKAKADGYDFLIIQDADEFYLSSEYEKNIQGIISNPDYSCYQVPWILFWKNIDYVLVYREHQGKKHTYLTTCPLYAVNLQKNVRFISRRIVDKLSQDVYLLPGICLHFSWVLSDEDVRRKLGVWSHASQLKNNNWYKWKWLGWHPKMKYLGAISTIEITKAVKYNGELPAEMLNYPAPKQTYKPLKFLEKIVMHYYDYKNLMLEYAKKIIRLIIKKLFIK